VTIRNPSIITIFMDLEDDVSCPYVFSSFIVISPSLTVILPFDSSAGPP
jgi:hypothetical protein